ncbi:translation initiation factor 2 [Streptococcus suis]|uniref:Translation initiation factor 2 n=1 Tax=Streptococcus suis TaxID=1307 RepID=A0AAD0KUT7_STRSU|nr:translation initiation factor 2 [Streptococcus suis]AWX95625.1 translation initiation factor 2 [Streptococcus suis]AWX97574.1 translation initiation factor 2 [Streptococcus suis]MBS8055917.1 translation initiation factor 2 [Streptococcus suis]MBS8070255.1 translation initiation factor 2 [Streptococcus suis]MBS8102256.1 translation initiation factor 2 [Streptococcus suis]
MSKRKIISSLFLSATVLGGLLFTQTPTVKAIASEGVEIISPKSESAPIFSPGELIQETNYNDLVQKSVSIEDFSTNSNNEFTWKVKFDPTHWNFTNDKGGYYFIIPEGLKLKSITDQTGKNLLEQFPKDVSDSNNNSDSKYRLFKKESNASGDRNFESQWGWSAGRVGSGQVNQWKDRNLFSEIYYIDKPGHSGPVTYQLSAEVTNPQNTNTSFPLVAVMKNYYAKTWYLGEPASLAGREVTIEPRQTN